MNINQKCINTARMLAAEMIHEAGSGHTGIALDAAPIIFSLFKDHYNFYSSKFISRDRFVLSAGHASALYYAMLSLFGFDVSVDDLKNFRKLDSKTPGHPEFGVTDGVEVSTGPLGQGIANAVGLAMAEAGLSEKFNAQKFDIINNYTYCFAGDGCLMEGVAQEAISLAGKLKLNKLILLYDCNKITIDGKLDIANTENISKKFKSMGWNVITVRNGNSYHSCTKAISNAKKSKNKPTVIIFKTQIGYGTKYQGSEKIHGKALNDEELDALSKNLCVPRGFEVEKEVKEFCYRAHRRSKIEYFKWEKKMVLYKNTHPELCEQFFNYFSNPKLNFLKLCKGKVDDKLSMREINAQILNVFAKQVPSYAGGTADLAPSTMAYIEDGGDFSKTNYRGRNIHYGVREHAMGAISNGMALYDMNPVFCSTFLSFSNYLIPAARMSALMNLPVQYIFTHDSIMVGQDGPTHQPIEQLSMLRSIPNLTVYRPASANELMACYENFYESKNPCAFVLAKQKLEAVGDYHGALKGAYVLSEAENPSAVIFASGSEVDMALQAQNILKNEKISAVVVSVPCLELFEKQNEKYRKSVLKNDVKLRVAVEASNDYRFAAKLEAKLFGVEEFGKSAPGKDVAENKHFTADDLVKYIKNLKNSGA